ncbi:hypothetical protein DTO021D3_6150 [Paecilomyces variotii]|nr:hypothetical protein DTO032I3_4305 [Paecilomyces variotii]KAJ9277052.1 hypothetical protein DTO021D3_6150 [Paecilomyces variotii]KAJ9339360.1 hypothetical protein DTO027B6_8098 [Paecilomyces variotii]KAJ9393258.1 hypothetical protein DTO032I4_29 [Paecilomyces variotii]
MFRRMRQTEPDRLSIRLSKTLEPFNVAPWGALAMWYLGVPIAVGAPMIVVQDDEYTAAIERLESAGFCRSVPNRVPPPEIMENHPDPQQMLEEINAGYNRLDRSCAVFNYPDGDPAEKSLQLYLFPNSFAHLFQEDTLPSSSKRRELAPTERYKTYGNLHYPLEGALVESFVKSAIDEETETAFSAWGETLRSWISLMTGYLEVDNDVLDNCPDGQAVEWYSHNFGRIREANFGPIDRRISKRLGSGRDMPIDMRGNPIQQ